jgi:hypothetical protein
MIGTSSISLDIGHSPIEAPLGVGGARGGSICETLSTPPPPPQERKRTPHECMLSFLIGCMKLLFSKMFVTIFWPGLMARHKL